MADLTTPIPQVSQAVSQREVQINANFDAASTAMLFGRNQSTSANLVFGYIGGRFNGTAVANGTVTATDDATNYVVVHRTTLAVSASTSNTNWNDTTTYGRAYMLTAADGAITDYEDHREGTNGIMTPISLAPSGSAGGDLTGTYPNPTIKPSVSLTTPLLGTPTSGNLSNCTADGTNAVGFRHVPQNSQSTAYTTVLADAGKHILHPAADTNARTFTIDSNANVAYPIGTAITFVNETSQVVTIAITSDTLVLGGTTTTGSRSLAQNGVATALKVTSTKWIITGTGLT